MGMSPAGTGKMSIPFSEKLLRRLAEAHTLVAFTGAGVSAESGIPTFRGNDGIWVKFKPEELANINAFMRNPELVWEWYKQRKRVMASVQPNRGHYALAAMQELFPECEIITQNIDNLHHRAGSTHVHELHGNIERNYCTKCGALYSNEEVLSTVGVPLCTKAKCGGKIRPDVVWFGELLPEDEWKKAIRAAERADVFLSIGTSNVVHPAATIPLGAKQSGAYLVEINPEQTPLTGSADEFIPAPSGEVLPALLEQIREMKLNTVKSVR